MFENMSPIGGSETPDDISKSACHRTRMVGLWFFFYILFSFSNKQQENPDVVSPQKTESLWHLSRFENRCLWRFSSVHSVDYLGS